MELFLMERSVSVVLFNTSWCQQIVEWKSQSLIQSELCGYWFVIALSDSPRWLHSEITASFKTDKQVIRAKDQPHRCSLSTGPVVQAFQWLCNKSQPSNHLGVSTERCSTGSSRQTTPVRCFLIGREGDCKWRVSPGYIPAHIQVLFLCDSMTAGKKKQFPCVDINRFSALLPHLSHDALALQTGLTWTCEELVMFCKSVWNVNALSFNMSHDSQHFNTEPICRKFWYLLSSCWLRSLKTEKKSTLLCKILGTSHLLVHILSHPHNKSFCRQKSDYVKFPCMVSTTNAPFFPLWMVKAKW